MDPDSRARDRSRPLEELHSNERVKQESRQLRGTLDRSLADPATGAIDPTDTLLTKFFGIYQQDDRDLREERRRAKLEPRYQFMVRVRLPGGVCTPRQWLALDELARKYGGSSLRLTTRQTFQFHGIRKNHLRAHLQGIHAAGLDTIAACGDDNRNVICTANPLLSPAHAEVSGLARRIGENLLPKTGAYREIFLQQPAKEQPADEEPLYGSTYLPRKFKIALAVPPQNDIDVFAHDLGFIAITDAKGALAGWNVSIGGGMGMTHGDTATFPRTGDVIGFCTPDQAIDVAEKVMLVQRDWGNRENRANARLKYTVERFGADAYRAEVEKRLGYKLGDARPFKFTSMGDPIGWHQGPDKKWHLGLFIENGRIKDTPDRHLRTALREIAQAGGITFSLTGNQNIIICNVGAKQKAKIEATLKAHGIDIKTSSGLRRNSISCVALPTCALALAESERFLPELITTLEDSLDKAGLREDDIVIRMTGCPNGCVRTYQSDIGIVGRSGDKYTIFVGGNLVGSRLGFPLKDLVPLNEIVPTLQPILSRFREERQKGEGFGDFCHRLGEEATREMIGAVVHA